MVQVLEELTNREVKDVERFLATSSKLGSDYGTEGSDYEGLNCICHCDTCHCQCHGCVSCYRG